MADAGMFAEEECRLEQPLNEEGNLRERVSINLREQLTYLTIPYKILY